MLRTTDRSPARSLLLLGALVAGVALVAAAQPTRAADLKKDTSLSVIPADAAFYMTMLRNKEQLDLFYKSNAYKTLRDLPLVKEAYAKAKEQMSKEGGPLESYKEFTKNKDNQEAVDVLLEGLNDEIFVYGGKSWSDLAAAYGKLRFVQYSGMLQGISSGTDPNKAGLRAMMLSLQKDRKKLKVPELVFGFKLKDTKKADKQVTRLFKMATAFVENFEPVKEALKGKVKQSKVAGGTFLTVELDGNLVPWDSFELKELEQNAGELKDLMDHLKKQKLTVSLGTLGGYLMLGFTSSTKELEALAGKDGESLLAGRDELKPLWKHAEKSVTDIGYSSAALAKGFIGDKDDVDDLIKQAKASLSKAEQLKEERRKSISKDLDELAKDLKSAYAREVGGGLSFSYLTKSGYEGWRYDYSDHGYLKDTKLALHNHFGGNPIFAAAFAFPVNGTYYATFSKWVKKIYGHGEGIFMDMADADSKDMYNKVAKELLPQFKRLDENTTKNLIPALKRGGLGLVIDGKWKSKEWFQGMPKGEKELPMLELGLLVGLGDGKKFAAAMTEYRKTINDLIAKAAESVPNGENIAGFKLPVPDSEEAKGGTVYTYAGLEGTGLDKQFVPTAGVGKSVAVLTFSKKHAERVIASTPLKSPGVLDRKGPLVGCCYLDFPAFVDLAMPWVEFAAQNAPVPEEAKDAKKKLKEALAQGKVVAQVLKTFKGATCATYLEGKTMVSHVNIVVKDLEKVVKVGGGE